MFNFPSRKGLFSDGVFTTGVNVWDRRQKHKSFNISQYIIIEDGMLRFNSFNITFKREVYFTVHSLGSIRTNFNEINGVIISLMIF